MDQHKSKPIKQVRSFLRNGRALSFLTSIFAKVETQEQLIIPDGEPFILAANHRSFFDFIIAWKCLYELGLTCHCLIRADLFEKPVIGGWLKRNGCIPASKATRQEAENLAVSLLSEGYSVAIMPEGRLVPEVDRPDGVGQGRPGISRIATAANVSILPIAIEGTDKVWPMGKAFPRLKFSRPTITVKFGHPIKLPSNDDIINVGVIMDEIKTLLNEG
ncbi:MAG: hypothetical protein CL470_04780 [Acidimicrobiaceae bacterium]|nr:hypothetical protein [Acidimicrobiaceae bacterium]|tara:strand:- start:265 stop:918 length:654 start_codon:yes stop_codon:yes gene_type:complete